MIPKQILARLILDFDPEKLPDLVERELEVNLPFPIRRAAVILGPRRSGKTYYLFQLIQKLIREKKARKENLLYINFENPELVGMEARDLAKLAETFFEINPQSRDKKTFFFLDEIQNVSGWETFVRYLLDKYDIQPVLSGSSSKLLSQEIATSLRGRAISYLIFPFSFREILKVNKLEARKYFSSEERASVERIFGKYLRDGGYPETLFFPKEREKIINEIAEVTIFRDLVERHKIRNTKVVKLMFQFLSQSKEFSIHQFFRYLKSMNIKVSKNSLYEYLEYFRDAFIFFPLRKFSYSAKDTEQSLAKIYAVDNGLIGSLHSEDLGKKFENAVFLELMRKEFVPGKNLFYLKINDNEVDFAIVENKKVKLLIQACWNLTDFQTKERELKSLVSASEKYSCKNLLVLTGEHEREELLGRKKIRFIPLWKWLINPPRNSNL